MKEINCEIIQDLLPGYIDDVISEVSRDAVEEHMEQCSVCKTVYEEMSENIEQVPEQRTVPDFTMILKRIEKIFFRKGVIISFIIFLILTVVWKCYQYAVTPMPVPPEAVSVTWEDETDGSLTLKITVDNQYLVDVSGSGWEDDGITYQFHLQTNLTQIDQKIPFLGHEPGLNKQELVFSPEERKTLKVVYRAKDYWGNTGMDERVVVYDSDLYE